ncbi:Uncharacterised protein [Mycobacterium tuberculosis]|nr:Uncharacterised protein [Mycobacterium tuberculosis]
MHMEWPHLLCPRDTGFLIILVLLNHSAMNSVLMLNNLLTKTT